jgi:hypothetical protein
MPRRKIGKSGTRSNISDTLRIGLTQKNAGARTIFAWRKAQANEKKRQFLKASPPTKIEINLGSVKLRILAPMIRPP